MFVYGERVREGSVSVGTGDFTVTGAPDTTYQTFAAVMSIGDTTDITIFGAGDFEFCRATYTALNTLQRGTIYDSTNGGARVNFAGGAKTVVMGLPGAVARALGNDELLNKSGGTMTGPLVTDASDAGAAGLNVPHGIDPSAPNNGDFWSTVAGFFARINGVTHTLLTHAGGTLIGLLATVASTTSSAGLRVPHGAAPTSPTNGDVWSTTAAFFARINGVTHTLLTLAGGTLTGLLATIASATGSAGFRLPHGVAPSAPVNGDIWTTTTAFLARLNGGTASFSGVNTGDQTRDGLSVHGADIAAATTTNLETATGYLIDITGSTQIDAITLSDGHERWARFTGAPQLTNGASLVVQGGTRTMAAGDYAHFKGYAAGVVRATIFPASGKAPIPPAFSEVRSKPTTLVGYGITDAETLGEISAIRTANGSDTLVLTDKGKTVEMNVASANNLTIPQNASVAFPVETYINVVQMGAGQTTLVADTNVVLRFRNGLKVAGQYGMVTLYKRATNEWVVGGDTTT